MSFVKITPETSGSQINLWTKIWSSSFLNLLITLNIDFSRRLKFSFFTIIESNFPALLIFSVSSFNEDDLIITSVLKL